MNKSRFEVNNKYQGHHLNSWRDEARKVHGLDVDSLLETHFYLVEANNNSIEETAKSVLSDSVLDEFHTETWKIDGYQFVVEVGFKPGVTDNSAKAVKDAFNVLETEVNVSTGKLYWIKGGLDRKEAEAFAHEVLANPLLNSIKVYTTSEFSSSARFSNITLPEVKISGAGEVQIVNLDRDDKELEELSVKRCLALTVEELKTIREFYSSKEVLEKRKLRGLPSQPTDVELEVLAQTWSEHCKHKIFASEITYSEKTPPKYGPSLGPLKVNSIFKTFIKDTTEKIKKERELPWLISVFSDNAGIVRFDKKVDLCFKAETHNSPSALDPYGGALTGILGVNRDILGCGLGAKPIANTDVFCFAPPSLGDHDKGKSLPVGPKGPRRMLEGVHKGVEDGGNKSGIPTVNGAFFFDSNYAGKPLVFCGTVGVMPQVLPDGRTTEQKGQKPGDRIYMVGGAIGADGIHGATFSSLELDENSPATAVQIGDPITQKRVMDFMLEARDRGLYTSVTDNGAGGLSSSVGEMAELSGGARVDLAKAPTKYPGLKPYELFISESQERMTFSVLPEKAQAFEELAKKYSVDASDIGEFTDTGSLEIKYGEELVGSLDLDFLHDGLPQMKVEGIWEGEEYDRENWHKSQEIPTFNGVANQTFYKEHLKKVLASPTVASKEEWVRKYDHEVQGATHIKPFNGINGHGPNDSAVVWLGPHGGEEDNAIAIGCGIAPRLSLYDTYLMAQFSVDEAFRNIVVSGADPETVCLLDNFCWPDPVYHSEKNKDGKHKMSQLLRACKGLSDICEAYGAPLVSGKDSMKNDFRGKNSYGEDIKVSVLPTLLVSAMGKSSVSHSNEGAFQKEDDLIYLIGGLGSGLLGSELLEQVKIENCELPKIDLSKNYERYKKVFRATSQNLLSSLHDISDGGLVSTLSESCFGNLTGAMIKLSCEEKDLIEVLFNEAPGRFVASVKPENKKVFEELFTDEFIELGKVTSDKKLIVKNKNQEILDEEVETLLSSWRTPLC